MAINFTDSPSNGATQTIGGRTYTYNSAKNKWDTTATEVTGPTATVYASVDALPTSGVLTGDQAFVSGTNRLYIWNGTGWYNIALINTTPSISGASASYALATDGTATTVTITATDPEGLPITYSIASDTSGNTATVTQGTGSSTNVFTITPSTNTAHAGTFSLTFRASDGVNLATAVSSFTLAFAVQNSNYTTALVTSVGTNNQVNNTFTDSSTNSHTITAYGNTTQTTFSPYRHGGYSTYFDGSGDYLNAPYTVSNFGTGDFTLETWVYNTDQSGYNLILDARSAAATVPLVFGIHDTNHAYYYNGTEYKASTTVPLNEWVHLAIARSGSTLKIFQNGVEVLSRTDSSDLTGTSTNQITIGRAVQGASHFYGYMSDFRIVKGSAVYTSAFTPPTERLTAITNTSLLTCHLPYIADGSTNGHAITANGNTKTEPFAPYDYETYSAADNGGSIYFDGSGDYLTSGTSASLALGSGDFTFECWVYPPSASVPNYAGIYSSTSDGIGDSNALRFGNLGTDATTLVVQTAASSIFNSTSGVVKVGQWNHVALVRSGTSTNNMTIYVNGAASGSGTSTANFSTGYATIGTNVYNGVHYLYSGYLADLRVVSGTAVYTADFTPPTAPLTAITNTSLLVQGTNAGIIDKSQSTKGLTLNGDVKSSTTQTKYLSSSMYFDGTGDYIDLPDFVSDYGSKDFTVEVWIYPTAVGTRNNFGDFNSAGQNASSSLCFSFANDKANWYIQTTTANSIISTASISANAWTHIALVRNGSTITQYINGSSDGTLNVGSASINQSSIVYTLGTFGDYQANFYQGYMSDFRVTKGLARYTANFTPPTAALQG